LEKILKTNVKDEIDKTEDL